MYDCQLLSIDTEAEADIYEDLSHLIKTFKKVMDLSSEIVDQLEEEETGARLIAQLREVTATNHQIVEHYNHGLQEHSVHKNTFSRFVCRLYETVSVFKSHCGRRNQAIALYKEFLNRTEQSINAYQADKNIGRMFKKFFQFTDKFCLSCEIILNQGFREQILTYFSKNEELDKDQGQAGDQKAKKIYNTSSETNFHKAMNALNRRFSTLSCLDLDYNSFKGYYFQSRSEKMEMEKEYLQRNALIWKEISVYSKTFYDYIKKRQKISLNRKNRLRERMERLQSMKYEPIETDIKVKTEMKNTIDSSLLQQFQKGTKEELPSLKRGSLREELEKSNDNSPLNNNSLREEGRKTHYHLKNIYLTLNKITNSNASGVSDKSPKPTQKKSLKEKLNHYGQYKAAKISIKAARFNQMETFKQRPLLDIRHIDSRDFGFTVEGGVPQDICRQIFGLEENKSLKMSKQHFSKKSITQKKSIRIAQLLNKSNINSKLQVQMGSGQEMLYNIRVVNGQEGSKR